VMKQKSDPAEKIHESPTTVMIDALTRTPGRATLHIQYGQEKKAKIELPVSAHERGREPNTDLYRRDLTELMDALYQWALSRGDIFRPPSDEKADAG
jgi:hypothetical protein